MERDEDISKKITERTTHSNTAESSQLLFHKGKASPVTVRVRLRVRESGRSSTFREIRAAWFVLQCLAPQHRSTEIKARIAHQCTARMSASSRILEIHKEAILIYKLCK